jgi:hypothetical protein
MESVVDAVLTNEFKDDKTKNDIKFFIVKYFLKSMMSLTFGFNSQSLEI